MLERRKPLPCGLPPHAPTWGVECLAAERSNPRSSVLCLPVFDSQHRPNPRSARQRRPGAAESTSPTRSGSGHAGERVSRLNVRSRAGKSARRRRARSHALPASRVERLLFRLKQRDRPFFLSSHRHPSSFPQRCLPVPLLSHSLSPQLRPRLFGASRNLSRYLVLLVRYLLA